MEKNVPLFACRIAKRLRSSSGSGAFGCFDSSTAAFAAAQASVGTDVPADTKPEDMVVRGGGVVRLVGGWLGGGCFVSAAYSEVTCVE